MRFKSDITGESQLILEKYTGANYDGTPSYILGVDGSGNVLKQQASDFTPTQEEKGTFSGTSDDLGNLTFTHTLGYNPSHIILTCSGQVNAGVSSSTSTQVTISTSQRNASISGYYTIS